MTDRSLQSTRGCLRLSIASTWDGVDIGPSERVTMQLELLADELVLRIDAPFHHDPAPGSSAGSTDALWRHEVVELMLLGSDERYLEVELSPHGHYLVLMLQGRRNVVRQGLQLDHQARICGDRWTSLARIPAIWLPAACERLNAYALHGTGDSRRYLAWQPRRDAGSSARPDFHHLPAFGALRDCERVRRS